MREAVLLSFSEFIVVQCAGINGLATISRTKIRRQDFVITNKRDQRLQCSFWEPQDPSLSAKKLPAVIYCHCNSGSRLDAAEAIGIVLPMSVRVFALDFSVRPNCTADVLTACSPVFHKALRPFAAPGVVHLVYVTCHPRSCCHALASASSSTIPTRNFSCLQTNNSVAFCTDFPLTWSCRLSCSCQNYNAMRESE
jgi:hypothetical protein